MENRPEEKILVARCIAGDAQAREELVLRHRPLLLRQVRRVALRYGAGEDAALVQDLLQEAFQGIFEGGSALLRDFRGESSLARYLAVAAAHRAARVLRRRRDLPLLDPERLEEEAAVRLAREEVPEAAEALHRREVAERVHRALRDLSPRERLALRFFYWDGLPGGAVARALGLSEGAVHMLVSRARARLRELLKGLACL